MKESQSFQSGINGIHMNLTIIPYTNACVIAVGPKGLLGFMHESVCTNLAVSPITHRILLGDRELCAALYMNSEQFDPFVQLTLKIKA